MQGLFAGVLCAANPDPKIKHPINGDPTPLRTLLCALLVVIVCRSTLVPTLWNAFCSQLLISAVDTSYSIIGIDEVDNVQDIDIGCRDHDQNAGGCLNTSTYS